MEKQCRCCKQVFPNAEREFKREPRNRDGLGPYCRACKAAKAADYYKRRGHVTREYSRKFYERLKASDGGWEKIKEWNLRSRERARPEAVERTRKWRKENPEQRRALTRKRKAQLKGTNGVHTAADVRRQYVMQSGRCFWCDNAVAFGYPNCHVDHLIPLSRGGSNWHWNIVIACPRCNMARKHSLPLEWAPKYLFRLRAQAS